jgi:hypothetical protein
MSIEQEHGMADGTAEEFILAAIHLSKACSDSKLIAPTMVNFSFAIELHIKAILASYSIDPKKEHNLYKLFLKLPEEKRKWMLRMYALIAGETSMDIFVKELERWALVFVSIRYHHDSSTKGSAYFDLSNFIPNLAISLNNTYLHTEKYVEFCFPQLSKSS